MTLLSVVVPVYNVATYVEDCLRSIAAQTHRDLDVVVVDDGSTDGSAAIAARFVEQDARFRLVRQPNGGLGNARNTGVGHAHGELLAFVDSDDLLPPRAHELLVGALERSSSDLATGAFRRVDASGSRPAYYAAAAFAQRRREEHIRRFHQLVVDRTAWNKVFRREFWDRHGFRFGEGVCYEDQYATLPAHFLARSVEVLPSTVYYWRLRAGSITDDRSSPTALRDRIEAIAWTRRWLLDNGFADDVAWYDASVAAQDLSYAPHVIATMAEGDDRARLLDRLLELVGSYPAAAFDRLPVLDRLAWQLVGRGDFDRVQQLAPFRDQAAQPTAVRRWRRWYADVPVRRDRHLPRRLFRVEDDIVAVSEISRIAVDAAELVVEGTARLSHRLGERAAADRIVVLRLRSGDQTLTPTVTVRDDGYVARLRLDRLRMDGHWRDRDWEVEVEVASRGLRRLTSRHRAAGSAPLPGLVHPVGPRRQVRAELTGIGGFVVHVERRSPRLTGADVEDGALVLRGQLTNRASGPLELRLTGSVGKRQERPAALAGGADTEWVAALPLAAAASDLDLPTAPQALRRQAMERWELSLVAGTGRRLRIALDDGAACGPWQAGDRRWWLDVARTGFAVLVEQRAPMGAGDPPVGRAAR